MSEFGAAEADTICPVSLDVLGVMYRADAEAVAAMLSGMSEDRRARLAFFCYGRAHLRDLALVVASSVEEGRLAQLAGTMGQVVASQARAKLAKFGRLYHERQLGMVRPKVSLGGSRRA